MAKGIIIYQSKYGATKKYVDWLQEKTGFAVTETKRIAPNDLKQYETLIWCGGIYASGIAGLSVLKKNFNALKEKQIMVFGVGASPYDENALCQIKEHNLKGECKDIPLFYGRGAWDEGGMTAVDRTLCKLLQKSVAKKEPDQCEPWMKALLCAVGQTCDWTDQTYLKPLLDYLGNSNE